MNFRRVPICFMIWLFGFTGGLASAESAYPLLPNLSSERGSDPKVIEYVSALEGTVLFADERTRGSYSHMHAWYLERLSSRRFSARGLSVFVIVLGASIPLISILDRYIKNPRFWISFIGAAIVVAQGFSQTFQYTESWKNYTVALLSLEQAHQVWQTEILDASLMEDGSLEAAKKATKEFSTRFGEIVLTETSGFFSSIKDPADSSG